MDLSAFNLQGKVALITGGAHGIGFSIAEGMAKCGAVICFNCSSEASLEKGMAAYKAAGIDAHGYVADVSDEDAVNAMVAKIKAEVGSVDILVNNAGLMKRVPMIEMSHADFMRVIDVHVGGAFNCSKAVLPGMMEKREGKIINGSRHPFDQFIVAKTPAGRWGEPEDMVGPCVFLASHASDFVNGQILYADGGILAYIGRQPK